jgi:hypothetical protein
MTPMFRKLKNKHYSQSELLEDIKFYLTKQNREADFIEKFSQGYCQGLTVLAMHCMRQQILLPSAKDNDNWDWFVKAVNEFSKIKAPTNKSKYSSELDNFISHIEFFQNITGYQNLKPGELDQYYLADGADALSITKKFSIAGMFNLKDFFKRIRIKV